MYTWVGSIHGLDSAELGWVERILGPKFSKEVLHDIPVMTSDHECQQTKWKQWSYSLTGDARRVTEKGLMFMLSSLLCHAFMLILTGIL